MAGQIKYTDKQIQKFKDIIINEIWNGNSLRKILRDNKKLPSRRYVYEWLNPNNERFDIDFSNHYAHAKEESADIDFEKVDDYIKMVYNQEIDPKQGQVMIHARMWIASHKRPTKYGKKVTKEHTGKVVLEQITGMEIK